MLNFLFYSRRNREPTMLENFSRTVRNFVPSSIPIPTAAPSPPRVSRPVSFGFMTAAGSTPNPTNVVGGARERAGLGPDYYNPTTSHAHSATRNIGLEQETVWVRDQQYGKSAGLLEVEDEGWGSGQAGASALPLASHAYPSQRLDEEDDIIWARWDILHQGGGHTQRRLVPVLS
jgi:hypothetical protein